MAEPAEIEPAAANTVVAAEATAVEAASAEAAAAAKATAAAEAPVVAAGACVLILVCPVGGWQAAWLLVCRRSVD